MRLSHDGLFRRLLAELSRVRRRSFAAQSPSLPVPDRAGASWLGLRAIRDHLVAYYPLIHAMLSNRAHLQPNRVATNPGVPPKNAPVPILSLYILTIHWGFRRTLEVLPPVIPRAL